MGVCEAVGCKEQAFPESVFCRRHLTEDRIAFSLDKPRVLRKNSKELKAEQRCTRCGKTASEVNSFRQKKSLCNSCDKTIKKCEKAGRPVLPYDASKAPFPKKEQRGDDMTGSNDVEKQEVEEIKCSRCKKTPAEVSIFIKKKSLCNNCDQIIKICTKNGKSVPEYKPRKTAKSMTTPSPQPSPARGEEVNKTTLLPQAASPGGEETEPSDDKEVQRGSSPEAIGEGSWSGDQSFVPPNFMFLNQKEYSLTIDFKDHPELYEDLLDEAKEELRTPDMQLLWFLIKIKSKGERLVKD